ncbi:hypothetical protein ACHAP8_011594 [Fusarium lateritium]
MPKARRAAKGFIFITADDHGQAAAGDRKLIRSHVMRGKNTHTRALPDRVNGRSSAINVGTQRPQYAARDSGSSEDPHGARARNELLDSDEDALTRIRHAEMVPRATDMFPFVMFPEDIDSNSRSLLCTYSLRGHKSKRTEFHAYRMVHELNMQLSNPNAALTDSTTIVVMGLALIAESFGDVESAHMHVMGLKKIIDLRGGMESFASHPLLQSKLHPSQALVNRSLANAGRTGLVHSICTGANLAFYEDATLFDSAFDSSSQLAQLKPSDASCFSRSRSVVRTLKGRLYAIFKDVQDLSQLLNDSHDSGYKIREMSLEGLITCIQSRLLMLESEGNDIFSELLRLSLLSFLTTIFWSFPGVKFEYPRLANQLRQAFIAFTPSTPGERYLFAWALMVGATSIFRGHDQTWLLQGRRPLIWDSLGRTWFELKDNLRQVMWINSIHDVPGIEAFNQWLG